MKKGDTIKGIEVRPGMFISWYGYVLEVDLTGEKDSFFEGKPSLRFIDMNDPYWGACVGELNLEQEFTIVEVPNTPEYRKIINEVEVSLLQRVTDAVDTINEIRKLAGDG